MTAEANAAARPRRTPGPWIRLHVDPRAVRVARDHGLGVLADAQVMDPPHIEDVRLVVSELVTNAIQTATRMRADWPAYARPVHLRVIARPRWTHVYVVDPNPAEVAETPDPIPPDPMALSGRGLQIVSAQALTWYVVGSHGKTAHAVIPRGGHTLTDEEVAALRSRAIT